MKVHYLQIKLVKNLKIWIIKCLSQIFECSHIWMPFVFGEQNDQVCFILCLDCEQIRLIKSDQEFDKLFPLEVE